MRKIMHLWGHFSTGSGILIFSIFPVTASFFPPSSTFSIDRLWSGGVSSPYLLGRKHLRSPGLTRKRSPANSALERPAVSSRARISVLVLLSQVGGECRLLLVDTSALLCFPFQHFLQPRHTIKQSTFCC
ncbi:hypothetical protein TNIN_438531 [Trichonephila inaurata madagascariensis]|uniref:Uncharacterized protein n=1 Tax=Trichonephila inaurata madagascariensis TaxID=2747483 RepID=A0A8X6XUS8_9ARAC|nr:hypothetical protein TNIN_438531 [Trichonephila inaurata madagascariensis]